MKITIDQLTLPRKATFIEIAYKGDGNPTHDHEIIGVRFKDTYGNIVGFLTGYFPPESHQEES